MTRYLVGILFCFVMFLAYFAFRAEAFESLRHRKIRKRDIRQKQEGALNFWFYTALEKEYGLGKYGVLLRLYPVVVGTFTALHIPFGWIEALAWLDLALATVTALYLSAIILAACMEIAVVAGFAAFLGKYLEQQFNLTTSSANQLLGESVSPTRPRPAQGGCQCL